MKLKPSLIAVATAFSSLLLTTSSALAAAPPAAKHGEDTPIDLKDVPTTSTHAAGGGSIVRTIVGLAVVIGVIYGLYWVLKQVKSSREEKASGQGLAALATLPLGPSRSLQLVRAGRELVLIGVSEHGVTPVRTYSEDEAEAAGLLDLELDDDAPRNGNGNGHGAAAGASRVLAGVIDDLRRRTVRR
jgi:flagellar protein FliO/FliZ